METSESTWVKHNYIKYGVKSLRLRGLHYVNNCFFSNKVSIYLVVKKNRKLCSPSMCIINIIWLIENEYFGPIMSKILAKTNLNSMRGLRSLFLLFYNFWSFLRWNYLRLTLLVHWNSYLNWKPSSLRVLTVEIIQFVS